MPVMRLTETEGRVEGGEPVPVLRKEDNLKVDEGKDHGLSEFDFREEKRQQLSPGSGYIRDVGRHSFRADKRPPSVEADQGSAVSGEGRMAVKNFAVIKEHHGIEKNHAARSSGEPHSSSKQLHRPFSSPASTPSTPYSIPPSNPYSSSIPSPYSTPSTISSSLPPAPFSIPVPHPSLVPVSHPSIPSSLPYTLPAFTSTPALKQQASIPSSLTASVIPSANPHFAPYASQPGPRGPTPSRPATIGLAPPGSSPGAPPRPLPPAGGQPPYRGAPVVAVQPRPPMAGQTTPQFHQGVFNSSRPTKGGLTPPRVSNAPPHIRQSGAGANPVQHTAYEVKPLPEAATPLNFSNKIQPNASDISDSSSEPKSSLDRVAASGPVPVRIPLLSGAKVPRQGGPDHYMSGISSAGQQVKNEHSDIKPAAAVKTEVKEEKPEVGAPWFPGASRQSGSLQFKIEPRKDASTMTGLEVAGPGSRINLEGVVLSETDGGLLVVNVSYRGKDFMGTLMDCTSTTHLTNPNNQWASPRHSDIPPPDKRPKKKKTKDTEIELSARASLRSRRTITRRQKKGKKRKWKETENGNRRREN